MHFRSILFLLFCLSYFITAKAQYDVTGDICSHLVATGRVTLIQDDRLTSLLGTKAKIYYANEAQQEKSEKIKVKGFRIRVYSGNQQSTSKNRAYKIQSEMEAKMPDLSTYVTFKTPNWRLMAGDFRTSEEANSMLRLLRKEFPVYGKEMFVVSDEIEL